MAVNRRLGAGKWQATAAKSHSKRRQTAVSRQSNGRQSALRGRQMAVRRRAKSHSKRRQMAVSRQSNGRQSALTGRQMSVRRQRNHTQNAVKWQAVGSKWQAVGAYGQANVSQTAAKSHSKRRQMRQQMAGSRRLRAGKCQSAGSEITLKTPPNVSKTAGNWQAIGA